jgi:ribosome recycling factor
MASDIDHLNKETSKRMDEAVQSMQQDFAAVRTGKASPALIENLQVEYYGTHMKLRDIAGITAPEPRLLVIQPWDQGAVSSIEKAIQTSDIGISPVSDGRVIRLPVPELSEERRKEMTKVVKNRAEDARVAVRNIRREANDIARKAQKNSEITEDDLKDTIEDVQKLTDKHIERIDQLLHEKSEELLQI